MDMDTMTSLSPARAFVVHFYAAEAGAELQAGRVEHVQSGRTTHFGSWQELAAFVADSAGRQSWGYAGGIVLPEALAVEVIDHGLELSAAIDRLAGKQGIRDSQGAWGVLTKNLITRQDVLRSAAINAFAPFFNAAVYPVPDGHPQP